MNLATYRGQFDAPRVHNKRANTAPPDAVYIGRGSKWGNPYVIGKHGTRDEVIALYALHLTNSPQLLASVKELCGKHLVCFCAPQKCHGDILLAMAERMAQAEARSKQAADEKGSP